MTESSAGPWASAYHAPVLADEVVGLLAGARSVLDGTLGGGGHSLALLESGSDVTAIDRDPEAISAAKRRLASHEIEGRFRTVLGPDYNAAHYNHLHLDMGRGPFCA